jgi:hypothetical protein
MANMSYCRFHNTRKDLKDCITALENRNIANDEERTAALVLLTEICEYLLDDGVIEDYDSERIDAILTQCMEEKREGR